MGFFVAAYLFMATLSVLVHVGAFPDAPSLTVIWVALTWPYTVVHHILAAREK